MGVPLVLWGQVESVICIMAISIPVLRILLIWLLDRYDLSGPKMVNKFETGSSLRMDAIDCRDTAAYISEGCKIELGGGPRRDERN